MSGSTPADDIPSRRPDSEVEARARNESLGEMFASFSSNLSTLLRQEIQLAKAEATESARQGGRGAGMFAGAAVGALLALIFLSMALMWALGSWMHLGWAAVIVAVVWAVVTAVLVSMGRKQLDDMKGLPRTQETLGEIPPTLNPNKETP
ncbi:phage holin family protein [Corynebacterium sp. YIM 101645]|uniref:Phage holin family protein n=1 Tax=Corynebacterium lemuris TaxID=1859292 RepID=A0ABT2G0R5_9CORY|nr:phage holin family protein [Corynebacterium lemuris]MCS5480288.1 phage holin family protein [Corynebacterium lemuris]